MISKKHKCIFVHIPRTGGSTIETILWPFERSENDLWMGFISQYENKYQTGGLQHLYARHILQEVGRHVFEGYFKFAFVRNPWDKAVSQFSYMRTRKDLMDFIGMKANDSFRKYLDLIRKKEHVQWAPQYQFLVDDNGELLVDFLGRFENFCQDTSRLLKKLGLYGVQIPHVNKSVRKPYVNYYDHECIKIVHELYKQDIEMFAYCYE